MDSDIAHFVLHKIYLSQEEFINNICQRNYPYLFEYLTFYSFMSKKKEKFSFIKEDWDYNFCKNNLKNIHKAVEWKDYEMGRHEVELEIDGKRENVEIEVEKYNKDFIKSCMTYECENAIEQIKYIKDKYKEYIDDFKQMNM